MRLSSSFLMFFAFLLLVVSASCKKGDTGPQGPPGPPNNANVISKTFQPSSITWTTTIMYGTNYRVADLAIADITAAVLDSGAVSVYGGFSFTGTPWSALPFSYLENNITNYFSFGLKVGAVTVRWSKSTNTDPGIPSIPFRVVVIKGS